MVPLAAWTILRHSLKDALSRVEGNPCLRGADPFGKLQAESIASLRVCEELWGGG